MVRGTRRLYDPKADPGSSRASVEGDPARAAARDLKGGWRGKGGPRDKPGKEAPPDKEALREKAQELAKDKGIPLVHAYRILKGQTTLNEVLKGMMRKERFDRLVQKDGIDRELAGQVAAGHLPKKRAVVLTKMRELRGPKLHVDGVKAAEGTEPVALDLFGIGWVIGLIKAARAYDFDFLAAGTEEPVTYFKHDAKAICDVADLPAVQAAISLDDTVKSQGLLGTEDRAQRIRPPDDWMLDLIGDKRIVRFTMRDGEAFLAALRSFGRWDAELVLPGGETVTIFFHALHPISAHLGLTA